MGYGRLHLNCVRNLMLLCCQCQKTEKVSSAIVMTFSLAKSDHIKRRLHEMLLR
jgi:hypothetical protein